MTDREQRLAEIREYCLAACARTHWDGDVYGPRYRDDVSYLFAEVARLTDENRGLRLSALEARAVSLAARWSSQDAGLRAEVERLTAERDVAQRSCAVGYEEMARITGDIGYEPSRFRERMNALFALARGMGEGNDVPHTA